ncbi:hypothetical protein PM082_006192 [Marasmius tenuissimus]|nr:hypothetical protein PM082_006192 [Marasmius tenuissimus]
MYRPTSFHINASARSDVSVLDTSAMEECPPHRLTFATSVMIGMKLMERAVLTPNCGHAGSAEGGSLMSASHISPSGDANKTRDASRS